MNSKVGALMAELDTAIKIYTANGGYKSYGLVDKKVKEQSVPATLPFDNDKKIFSVQCSKDGENFVEVEPYAVWNGKKIFIGTDAVKFPFTLAQCMLLASIIAYYNTETITGETGFNLGALLFALLFGGSGNLVTNGFRSMFTDKDGKEMPEDVLKNEYMPLVQKAAKINELMAKVEALTEENSCSITAPSIVASIYSSKEELLELLKGHKAYLDSEMEKIFAPYAPKEDK